MWVVDVDVGRGLVCVPCGTSVMLRTLRRIRPCIVRLLSR